MPPPWAVAAHKLGTAFDTLTLETTWPARSTNPAFIAEVNQQLGLAGGHANTAAWLKDDQIHSIMARASDETKTAWANSPVPVNLWRTQFYRTIQNPAAHGRVNITVVNTQEQYRLTDEIAGTHWFVVAWRVEPAAVTAK